MYRLWGYQALKWEDMWYGLFKVLVIHIVYIRPFSSQLLNVPQTNSTFLSKLNSAFMTKANIVAPVAHTNLKEGNNDNRTHLNSNIPDIKVE